jgi:hypothetical protein
MEREGDSRDESEEKTSIYGFDRPMSDYIDKILTRSFGPAKTIEPRLASHFEPSFWDGPSISKHRLGLEEREFESPGDTRYNNPIHAENQKKSRGPPENQLPVLPIENPQSSEIRQAIPAEIHASLEASESQGRPGPQQRVTKPIEIDSQIDVLAPSLDSLLTSIKEENVPSKRMIAEKDKPISELTDEDVVNDREISKNGLLRTSAGDELVSNPLSRIRKENGAALKNGNVPDRRKIANENRPVSTIITKYLPNDQVISEDQFYKHSVRGEEGSRKIGKDEKENGSVLKIENKKRIALRDKDSFEDSLQASKENEDISSLSRSEDEDMMAYQHILTDLTRKTKSQLIIPSVSSPADIKSPDFSSQNKVVAQPYVRALAKPETSEPKEPMVIDPEPTIQVTIGRIEVKGIPQPSISKDHRWTPPVMSLENYLRQRNNGASS